MVSGLLLMIGATYFVVYKLRARGRYGPFTEKYLRLPGQSLNEELDKKIEDLMFSFYITTLMPIFYALFYPFLELSLRITYGIFMTFVVGYCLVRFVRIFWQIKKIALGLDGERYTGTELNYLMHQGAWIYHDIPYQYGNIDHVVVASGGVFAVETKAHTKPQKGDGKGRQYKVVHKDGMLKFPDFKPTKEPIDQATTHAKWLSKYLSKKSGEKVDVTPVVALPGWFVDSKSSERVLVINPKRGEFLNRHIVKKVIPEDKLARINGVIDDLARYSNYSTDIIDPDAGEKFDVLFNRKQTKTGIR